MVIIKINKIEPDYYGVPGYRTAGLPSVYHINILEALYQQV